MSGLSWVRSRSSISALVLLLAACDSSEGDLTAPPPDTTAVTTVALSVGDTTLKVGDTVRYRAIAHTTDGALVDGATFVWSSTTPAVASVDGGLVHAAGVGTSRIVAASGGHADTAVVRVVADSDGRGPGNAPAALTIAPHADSLVVGDSVQLVAVVTDSAGRSVTSSPIAWSSSDSTVLSVSSTGLVLARAIGSAHIAARSGALGDTATIVVRAGQGSDSPTVVEIYPQQATLTPGHCAPYQVVLSRGGPGAVVRWAVTDSTVVEVRPEPQGTAAVVCGRAAGTALVVAASGGGSDTLKVTVLPVPPTTRVTLGTLGGATSGALDVNGSDVVVGWSTLAGGGRHAFRWTQSGGMRDLGSLGGNSVATAVNEAGYVAGSSETPAGESRVVLWTPAGELQDLGVPPNSPAKITELAVNDINAGNVIVGSACWDTSSASGCMGFRWSADHGFAVLPIPGSRVTATSINDAGDITGQIRIDADDRWDIYLLPAGGAFVDLGAGENHHWANAEAINESREIAGEDEPAESVSWPNIWTPGIGFTNLRTFAQFDEVAWGEAMGLNDRGEVVGIGDTGAFYWTKAGGFVVFDGAAGAGATAVNDVGTVVGARDRVATLWRGLRGATAPTGASSLLMARVTRSDHRESVRKCMREHWMEGRARLAVCLR